MSGGGAKTQATKRTLYDEKAIKILFDTHWTAKGWKAQTSTTPADFSYAVSKGVMFPAKRLPHDVTLRKLRKLCATISPAQMGDAFLASLSSRELAFRSVLGSFAVARFLPVHKYTARPNSGVCLHCDLHLAPTNSQATNFNVLNFERLKWGGVRHALTQYQLLDLEQFVKLPPPEPNAEDAAILHHILATIRTLPAKATVGHLEKSLSKAFSSTKDERRILIEILCLCGVLSYPGYRNYFNAPEPNRSYRDSDWGRPAIFWRAEDGYNVERLKEYFPRYALKLMTA